MKSKKLRATAGAIAAVKETPTKNNISRSWIRMAHWYPDVALDTICSIDRTLSLNNDRVYFNYVIEAS